MSKLDEYLKTFRGNGGSYAATARKFGVNTGTIYRAIKRHIAREIRKGNVPEGYTIGSFTTRKNQHSKVISTSQKVVRDGGNPDLITHVPDPVAVKFTTTVFDANRNIERQWVREEKDQADRAKLWSAYAEELLSPVKFPEKELVTPQLSYADLLAMYLVGDYHTGMMAWALETLGDNFDSKVSERLLPTAAARLMEGAPPCETCVLGFMGDFTHYDSLRPETPRHKYLLDTDTRFFKVGRLSIRIVRNFIAAARQRHKKVHVIFLPGNHDESVAELINAFLVEFYADDPNVTIDSSPSVFRYFEWGNNLYGFHHGDKTKPERMPMVMANDMREAWGRCENRYIFTGHVHHKSMAKDESGVSRETVPVLIPNDAHSATHGYRNSRQMQVIIYDKIFGEEQRHTFNSERFFKPYREKERLNESA